MAKNARKNPLTIKAIERVSIGVTDPCRHNLNQHFASAGSFEIKLDDFEWLFSFKGYGGARFHGYEPLSLEGYWVICDGCYYKPAAISIRI
jgi:hypothetical protein